MEISTFPYFFVATSILAIFLSHDIFFVCSYGTSAFGSDPGYCADSQEKTGQEHGGSGIAK